MLTVGLCASAPLVMGAGYSDSKDGRAHVTSTVAGESGSLPALPRLKRVRDPGTVDPILGKFPVEASRAIQYAWVQHAGDGLTFTRNLRSTSLDAQRFHEKTIYSAGVGVCVLLSKNITVQEVLNLLGELFRERDDTLSDDQANQLGIALLVGAATDLCPELQFLLDDQNALVDTPVGIRSILGLGQGRLSDKRANLFANAVCQQLGRGTTKSRITSNVADDFAYPDDLAQELIDFVEKWAC